MRHLNSVNKLAIAVRDDLTCQYCGSKLSNHSEIHFDHVVAHARGGKTAPYNMVVSCSKCNMDKGALTWVPRNISVLSELNADHAKLIAKIAKLDSGEIDSVDGLTPYRRGRKRNPDCPDCKPRQVYCSAEDVLLCRLIVKLPADKKEFLHRWIDKGCPVKAKKED